MGLSAVVLGSDSRIGKCLVGGLSSHFHSVQLMRSGDELRERVAKSRPAVVILDMECARLSDVRNLHKDFPSLPIVCTHRIPDEELWVAALEAGASDVFAADDVQKVLISVLRSMAVPQGAAA